MSPARPEELVDPHRLGPSLDGDQVQEAVLEGVAGGLAGGLADHDLDAVFLAEPLEARRDVHRVADGRVGSRGSGLDRNRATWRLRHVHRPRRPRSVTGRVFALDIDPKHLGVVTHARKGREAGRAYIVTPGRDRDQPMQPGLADAAVGYAMLFNILHIECPGRVLQEARRAPGWAGIIHWRRDIPTPRGPSLGHPPDRRPVLCLGRGRRAGVRRGRGFVLLLLALGPGDAPPVASLCTPRLGMGRLGLDGVVLVGQTKGSLPVAGDPPHTRGGAGGPGLSPRPARPEMRTTRARGRCLEPGWSCFVGDRDRTASTAAPLGLVAQPVSSAWK